MQRKKFRTVDEYIDSFVGETRKRLEFMRQLIRSELPDTAVEKISYNIPTYTLDPSGKGYLVYFAGYSHHVSIYPLPSSLDSDFARVVFRYHTGKGTLRFPHDEPLPVDFIRRLLGYYTQNYFERPKR